MDFTSHAVTLVSIIIGIGLTEMFGNLHRLIRNRSRVTWDWLPVVWAAGLLLLVVNYWWAIYQGGAGFKNVTSAAQFGLLLIIPILLFLLTASILPNFDTSAEWDMTAHYGQQRKTFLMTWIVYQSVQYITGLIVGTLGWNVSTLVRSAILILVLVALGFGRRSIDWLASIAIFGLLAYRLTTQVMS